MSDFRIATCDVCSKDLAPFENEAPEGRCFCSEECFAKGTEGEKWISLSDLTLEQTNEMLNDIGFCLEGVGEKVSS